MAKRHITLIDCDHCGAEIVTFNAATRAEDVPQWIEVDDDHRFNGGRQYCLTCGELPLKEFFPTK